ncbi:MAG: CCA tRNA nucleotidyltransferase, partial [Bacteroidota bacterium]
DPAWRRLYTLLEHWQAPRFPLRGADALALGVEPGPAVGELLQQLESWWMDEDFVPSEADLRERLHQLVRERKA